MEVKRMFVPLEKRGKELEDWAQESGFKKCILETVIKQSEAITMYKKNNYKIIKNYGQYENVESIVCFEKHFDKNERLSS